MKSKQEQKSKQEPKQEPKQELKQEQKPKQKPKQEPKQEVKVEVKSAKIISVSKESKNDTILEIQEVDNNQSIIVNLNGNKQKFDIPKDFAIDELGNIFQLCQDKDGEIQKKQISDVLVFISSIIKDNETEEEKIEIVKFKNGEFTTKIFQRSQIYSRPIILSDFGITILSDNSKAFVKYLIEFEKCNKDKIQLKISIYRLGWINENKEFSPWVKDITINSNSEILEGYTEKGNIKDWVESFKPYRNNPSFRFVLSASFASVLLRILKERSFMINIVAPSRSRKDSNFSSCSFGMAVIIQN